MSGQVSRILVVEDHDDTRTLYVEFLEHAGFAPVGAASAVDALRSAREQRPDAIVTDLRLPGVDGFTAIEWIKADPALAQVPIIMLTGSVYPEEQQRAAGLGVAAFLKKPCLPSDLADTLRRVMAQQSS